jgi:hypothetical protein
VAFSGRGEPVTDFEVALLAGYRGDLPLALLGQRLIEALGARTGCQALAITLDELGGDASETRLRRRYVPPRRSFFQQLWRPQRDALVLALVRAGYSYNAVAQQAGLTRQGVGRIVMDARRGGGATDDMDS